MLTSNAPRRALLAMTAGMAASLLAAPLMAADYPAQGQKMPGWIRADPEVLAGKIPVMENATSIFPPKYFDDVEESVTARFQPLHIDRLIGFVTDAAASTTRSYDFPGDEVVQVRAGTMITIDEPSGRTQVFKAGDYFIVPKHWRGLWIFKSNGNETAREFSNSSSGQWATEQAPLDRAAVAAARPTPPGIIPIDLEIARSQAQPMNYLAPADEAKGASPLSGHIAFAGEPSLLYLESATGGSFQRRPGGCDAMMRVLGGSVTLEQAGEAPKSFGREEVLYLTRTFNGTVRLDAGTRLVTVISAGTESATVPAAPREATRRCSAF